MAYNPNNPNGQTTSANSAPVVIANDQSPIATTVSGVATSANQTTGNTSLASIVTNTTGVATAANQATGNTSLASIDGKLSDTANGLKVDGSGVTQPISATALPLPTGAATSAGQTTANTSLSSIVTNTANIPSKFSSANFSFLSLFHPSILS